MRPFVQGLVAQEHRHTVEQLHDSYRRNPYPLLAFCAELTSRVIEDSTQQLFYSPAFFRIFYSIHINIGTLPNSF